MKIALKILFFIFIGWMFLGVYLHYTNHPKEDIVIGTGVFFLAFILMPLFIFYRFKNGKYKKYVLDPKSKNPFKIDEKEL